MIGFYGRPNTKSLGILGLSDIDTLVQKMKKKRAFFKKELGEDVKVRLAFHIIHSLATSVEGRRGDYMLNISEERVLEYIKKAQEEDFDVILDTQLTIKTPSEAITPLLKYLKYDNIHLAIDPEFKIPKHKRYPPGRFIGHIYGDALNDAQSLMNQYLKDNNLDKRILMVHMFHKRMLRKKENVKNFDNIQLIYNIDGHGNSGIKTKIYNELYTQDQSIKAFGGFKVFYNRDTKPLMTPKKMYGLENVGSRTIQREPYYINYH